MNSRRTSFTFSRIAYLSNRDLLTLLSNIDNLILLQACYGSDEELIYRVSSVFSSTAKRYFFDDLKAIGRVSLHNTEKCREHIESLFESLLAQGEIKDYPPAKGHP